MKKPAPLLVHGALILVSLIYGLNYISLKTITPTPIVPTALLVVRSNGAFLFIWLLCELTGIRQKVVHWKHWLQLVLCGICGASANQLLFFSGISRTSAFNASLIVISIPIFVFLIAYLQKQEKLSWQKLLGICLGMLGAVLIIVQSAQKSNAADDSMGDILIILNCILFAIYLNIVKPLTKHYPPLFIAKWMFLFGGIISLPFGWHDVVATPWHSMSTAQYAVLFSLVVIVTSAGYVVNTWALKFANATSVSFYIYLQPFFTGIGSAIFLQHNDFGWQKILSVVLIFVGVYFVNKKIGT